jgi:mannosyltransferase
MCARGRETRSRPGPLWIGTSQRTSLVNGVVSMHARYRARAPARSVRAVVSSGIAHTSPEPEHLTGVMARPSLRSRFQECIRGLDVVLLAAIVVGAAARFWRVGAQSLWFDEWITTQNVSGGVRELFDHIAHRENIPPPYFLFMWGWVRVFGDGETAVRSVSVLAGIATIPIAYAIARELGQGRWVARFAALLVALNPMLVWYSQDARPYSLLAFFGALSVLAFARVWKHSRTRDYVVWGLVCAGALAIHYYAGFLIAAEFGALLVLRKRQWRCLLVAVVPALAVVVLLAPLALEQTSHSLNRRWISDWTLDYRLREAGRAALAGPGAPRERIWMVAAAIAVVAGVLLITRGSRRERAAAVLLAAIAGTAVLMPLAAAEIGFDVFLSRYLIGGLVPLLVAVAVGLGVRRAAWAGGAAVVVLCAVWCADVVAVARDPDLQKADLRQVAEVFDTGVADRALVFNAHPLAGEPLRYYTDRARRLGDHEPALVDEIDVVVYNAKPKPCDYLVGRACSLLFLGGYSFTDPIASQFALVDRVELDQFTVNRYRAAKPVFVTKAELVAPGNPAVAFAMVSRE